MALRADVILEERSFAEWLLEPLLALRARSGAVPARATTAQGGPTSLSEAKVSGMMIDGERRALFFHNPKTAGRSIIKSLGYELEQKPTRFTHVGPAEARRHLILGGFDAFWSFSFVRNPWSRAASLYFFNRSERFLEISKNRQAHQVAQKYIFTDWLQAVLEQRDPHLMQLPQRYWTEGVHSIYRYETLEISLPDIAIKLGRPYTRAWENRTEHADYRLLYSDKASSLIEELDRNTITQFNYRFG